MPGYNVISKGEYGYPQEENSVPAVNYIFINEDGAKYLLLNFFNTRRSVLTGLDLEITQLDGKGNEIGVKSVKYGNINAKPKKQFVLTHKIPVGEKCTDFKVKVNSAIYGAYSYSVKNGTEQVDYIPHSTEKFDVGKVIDKMGWESSSVGVRTVKRRVLIGLLASILIALVLVFTFLQLDKFKKEQVAFIYGGVEYAFENGDNSDESNISVVGYNGKTREVIIPEKIEKHCVTGIADGAFAGNANLRNLTISGAIPIGREAFSGCINLESISVDRVSEIGSYAFAGCQKLTSLNAYNLDLIDAYAFSQCTALESVSISNDKKNLRLGGFAFNGCTGLQTAEIAQVTIYPEENTAFRGCNNVVTLKLKNFETIGKNSTRSLVSVFGTGNNYGLTMKLQTLVIDSLDCISGGFAAQTPLRAFTVNNLEIAEIGNDAFYNCKALTEFTIPVKAESVGNYAFYGTGISSFDSTDLTYTGDYSFYGTSLKSFDGTNLAYVGDYSFAGSALESFIISGNAICNYIGAGAFSECKNLVTFELPANIRAIQNNTFEGCHSLQGITFTGGLVERIGEKAFSGCVKLSEFVFPSSITAVGSYAFEGCSSLSTVSVPATVASTGLGAFANCTGLNNICLAYIGASPTENNYLGYIFGADNHYNTSTRVPASLKAVTVTGGDRINDNAFYGCTNVEKIVIPDRVTHIGVSAFEGCASLKTLNVTQNLQTVGVNAFNGCSSFTSFEVPSSVISIGNGAFGNCNGLKSLTVPFIGANENSQYSYLSYIFGANSFTDSSKFVPASLKSVTVTGGNTVIANAFFNCENLQSITLPENLEYIGENAFYDCKMLNEIALPETLKYIGNNAFAFCGNIRRIIIPQTVTFIGGNVFQGCFRLYEIWNLSGLSLTAPNAIKIYTSLDEEMEKTSINGFTFASSASDNINYLIDYPENTSVLSLPAPFEYVIAGYLFYRNNTVTSVEIPSAVTKLGEYAFGQCNALVSVAIGGNSLLREICPNAFNGCTALQSFAIPDGIRLIQNSTFEDCSSLAFVTVPSSVLYIGQRAFLGCASLKEIILPDGVSAVDYAAFAGCTSLQSVVLPSTLGTIEEEAFLGCVRLRLVFNYSPLEITAGGYGFGKAGYNALVVVTSADEENCAEYVVEKGVNFLRYYNDWTAVWAEDGIAQIVLEAFTYNGISVDSFKVLHHAFADNETVTSVRIGAAVSDLGEYAFYNNSSLKRVTIDGASFNEIKPYTFSVCKSLQTVNISGSIVRIGDYAFSECGALSSLTLPDSLKETGKASFSNCTSLSTLTLPSELNKIGDYSFINCNSLTKLKIPSSVEVIGIYAFANCTKLSSLTVEEGVKEIGSYAFASTVINSVEIPSTVSVVGSYAFYYCSMLNSLKIAEGVSGISEYAFSYCTNLREASLASSVNYIGEYAFSYCFNLENLVLPASLKEIANYSFVYSGLKSVTIPASVTRIGDYAFSNNNMLESIALPEGVLEIAYGAFMNCGALTEVTISSTVRRIAEAAFSGCNRLYIVYNLGELNITERSANHGGVALNAVKVFSSVSEKAEFVFEYNFEFVLLDNVWYLFKYNAADPIIYLPEKFNFNGTEITQYTVRKYAFENVSAEGVVVPSGVSEIQRNSFKNSFFNVYYAGNSDGWAQVGASALPFVTCYYYVNCVHQAGQWTYGFNGLVSTVIDYYSFSLEVITPPTCVQDGLQEATCVNCGFKRTVTLEKTGIHEYEYETVLEPTCVDNGISRGTCIHCGKVITTVIEKTGVHEYEWKTTSRPTCTHEGTETGTCANCGDTTSRPVGKLPHTYVDGECTVCGRKSDENGN